MKSIQLKVILFLAVLPICGIYSQAIKFTYPTNQIDSRHQIYSSLLKKNLKSFDLLNKFLSLTINKSNHLRSTLIDSIVELCQPPFANQKYKFYYDDSGRLDSYLEWDSYNGQWNISTRNTYCYDSLGNLASEVIESFNDQWIPWFRTRYIYDDNRNQVSNITEYYIDTLWMNGYQSLLKYDGGGNLINNIDMQWNGQAWINIQQAAFFFKNGIRDSLLFQNWINGQWINSNSAKPEYDDQGNLITMLWKTWNDSQWVNNVKGNWDYGLYKNIVSGLIEDWNGVEWINDSRFSYSYNSDNLFTHGLNEIWQDGTWIPGDGVIYYSRPDIYNLGFICTDLKVYYSISSGVENTSILARYTLSQNYPNPFNPITSIRFSIPLNGLVQLQVFDILGREIATLVNEYKSKGNYEVNFDARKLPSGIYIYRINCVTFTQSKMMILQK